MTRVDGKKRITIMATENKRTLKIESVGDFASGKIRPKIRLEGHWLERAGFKPGHRVDVHTSKTGEMTLQFRDQNPRQTRSNPC
jgi:hypothetical protein